MKPALQILRGDTVHRRMTPFVSDFRYRLFMIDIDIDRLEQASSMSSLFAVDRSALFTFRSSDHGSRGKQTLREWAEKEFHRAGVSAEGLRIRLITFPRHAFYKFAPISLWLAEDKAGDPRGILYEVRNTFGERHIYAARLDGAISRHEADKVFHVSPFFDVSGTYQFSLQYGEGSLTLGVTTLKDGKPAHMASLRTKARPASTPSFARAAIAMPLSTLGVTIGIHWEALKLWLKGANYHSKPAKDEETRSVATPTGQNPQEHGA